MIETEVLELCKALIRRPSVTPDDAGCQDMIAAALTQKGFLRRQMDFGEVRNIYLKHGQSAPNLVFLGHTDVVPTGPIEQWQSPPFEPTIRDGLLYGRGAADMKSGVAAMVCALGQFVSDYPDHAGSVALLLTSDEEGPAKDGVRRVMATFEEEGEKIDYCLVGEPSSVYELGDMVRVGRRGSLGGTLTIQGTQGHVAYPDLADNPIHHVGALIEELTTAVWDDGCEDFPATSFQISNISGGTGVTNIIPGNMEMVFNFRHGVVSSAQSLRQRTENIVARHCLRYELKWVESGMPFLTRPGKFRNAVSKAVAKTLDAEPTEDTGGGTSDGRFVAPTGAEVVELGPVNASIHKIDEHVRVADLGPLVACYYRVMEGLMMNRE